MNDNDMTLARRQVRDLAIVKLVTGEQGSPMSLREVARVYDLSRQRVSQILHKHGVRLDDRSPLPR